MKKSHICQMSCAHICSLFAIWSTSAAIYSTLLPEKSKTLPLTSSILVAQIRETPNISKANDFSGHGENKLHVICPFPPCWKRFLRNHFIRSRGLSGCFLWHGFSVLLYAHNKHTWNADQGSSPPNICRSFYDLIIIIILILTSSDKNFQMQLTTNAVKAKWATNLW